MPSLLKCRPHSLPHLRGCLGGWRMKPASQIPRAGWGRCVSDPLIIGSHPHDASYSNTQRGPLLWTPNFTPLKPAYPTSVPFRHLPLLTDLNNTVLLNILQGWRVIFSLCTIQYGSHWPREAPEHWSCVLCNQELHFYF